MDNEIIEPIVKIIKSEHKSLQNGQTILFNEANNFLMELFDAEFSKDIADRKKYKTKIEIDYTQFNVKQTYKQVIDIGDNNSSLVSHIRTFADYSLNNEKRQQFVLKNYNALLDDYTKYWTYINESFVPYLILHYHLSEFKSYAANKQKAQFKNKKPDFEKICYFEGIIRYTEKNRRNLNNSDEFFMSVFPEDYSVNLSNEERRAINGYKNLINRLPRPAPFQQAKIALTKDETEM